MCRKSGVFSLGLGGLRRTVCVSFLCGTINYHKPSSLKQLSYFLTVSVGQESRLTGYRSGVSKLTRVVGRIYFLVVGGLKPSLCHWMSAGGYSQFLEVPTVPYLMANATGILQHGC